MEGGGGRAEGEGTLCPMPLPDPLAELLRYFEPLAAERHDLGSGPVLQTPGVNVLALNAAYVAQAPTEAAEAELHTFFAGHDAPPLVLSPYTWDGQDVGGLRVGRWEVGGEGRGGGSGRGV